MQYSLVPCLNLWVECDGKVVLSIWRVALLEAVAQTGSISGAAEHLQVPYRVAWQKIREMEDGLGTRLVETRVGGSDGGGAHLTPAAEQYVVRFRQFSTGLEEQVQRHFAAAFPEGG